MDSTTLVGPESIQDGEDLLRALPRNGVEVTGAAWAQTEGDGKPYLYIVSPTVEAAGPLEAANRLVKTVREHEATWTDPFRRLDLFAIKLIGPSEPLAREIRDLYQRFPDNRPTFSHGSRLTTNPLEPAYFYPAKMFATPAAPSA